MIEEGEGHRNYVKQKSKHSVLDSLSQGESGHILNRRLFVAQRMSSFTAEMKKISFL